MPREKGTTSPPRLPVGLALGADAGPTLARDTPTTGPRHAINGDVRHIYDPWFDLEPHAC